MRRRQHRPLRIAPELWKRYLGLGPELGPLLQDAPLMRPLEHDRALRVRLRQFQFIASGHDNEKIAAMRCISPRPGPREQTIDPSSCPVYGEANPFVHRGLENPKSASRVQVPLPPVSRSKRSIGNRIGDHVESGFLEHPNRTRHMKGRGNQ